MKKVGKYLIALLILMVSTAGISIGCGKEQISSISLSLPQGSNGTVGIGSSVELIVDIEPKKASLEDVSFFVSDTLVAIVSDSGKVTGISAGRVLVTAMSKDNNKIKDSLYIEVVNASVSFKLKDTTATYNGQYPTMDMEYNNVGAGNYLTYQHRQANTTGDFVNGLPIDAGTYQIRAREMNQSLEQIGGYSYATLTINPKAMSVSITSTSLDYTGAAFNEIKGSNNINKIVAGAIDVIKCTVTPADSTFASKIKYYIDDEPFDSTKIYGAKVYSITVRYTEDNNYRLSKQGSTTLTINKAKLQIVADNQVSVYGQSANPTLTFSLENGSSLVGRELVEYNSKTSDADKKAYLLSLFSGKLTVGSSAKVLTFGTYNIVQDSSAMLLNSNYKIDKFTEGTFVVGRKDLTLTPKSGNIFYGKNPATSDIEYNTPMGLITGDVIVGDMFDFSTPKNDGTTDYYDIIKNSSIKIEKTLSDSTKLDVTSSYNIICRPAKMTLVKNFFSLTCSYVSRDYAKNLYEGNTYIASKSDLTVQATSNNKTTLDGYTITKYDYNSSTTGIVDIGVSSITTIGKNQIIVTFKSNDIVKYAMVLQCNGANASDPNVYKDYSVNCVNFYSEDNHYTAFVNNTEAMVGTTLTTFKINKIALGINAQASTKEYGAVDPTLTYSTTGLLDGDTTNLALSGDLSRAAGENVGTYAINNNLLTNSDYSYYKISYTGADFTITPATLTITADALTKEYGATDPTLTYSPTGLKLSDTIASVTTGALARVPGEDVGAYAIRQGTLRTNTTNYTLSFVGADLTISPKKVWIVIYSASKTYGEADPTYQYRIFNATGSSPSYEQGSVDLTSSISSTPTITRVQGEAVGTYALSIGESNSLGNNYTCVGSTSNDLTISPRTATVSIIRQIYESTKPEDNTLTLSVDNLASWDRYHSNPTSLTTTSTTDNTIHYVTSAEIGTKLNDIIYSTISISDLSDCYILELSAENIAFELKKIQTLQITIADKTIDYGSTYEYSVSDITNASYTDSSDVVHNVTIVAATFLYAGSTTSPTDAGVYGVTIELNIMGASLPYTIRENGTNISSSFDSRSILINAGTYTISDIDYPYNVSINNIASYYGTTTKLSSLRLTSVTVNGTTYDSIDAYDITNGYAIGTVGNLFWQDPDQVLSAGTHTCNMIYRDASNNYKDKPITVSISVAPQELATSSLTWNPNVVSKEYTGNNINFSLTESVAANILDNVNIAYNYYAKDFEGNYVLINYVPANVGEYKIIATLTPKTSNYSVDSNAIIREYVITAKGAVSYAVTNLTYSPNGQNISVGYGKTDADADKVYNFGKHYDTLPTLYTYNGEDKTLAPATVVLDDQGYLMIKGQYLQELGVADTLNPTDRFYIKKGDKYYKVNAINEVGGTYSYYIRYNGFVTTVDDSEDRFKVVTCPDYYQVSEFRLLDTVGRFLIDVEGSAYPVVYREGNYVYQNDVLSYIRITSATGTIYKYVDIMDVDNYKVNVDNYSNNFANSETNIFAITEAPYNFELFSLTNLIYNNNSFANMVNVSSNPPTNKQIDYDKYYLKKTTEPVVVTWTDCELIPGRLQQAVVGYATYYKDQVSEGSLIYYELEEKVLAGSNPSDTTMVATGDYLVIFDIVSPNYKGTAYKEYTINAVAPRLLLNNVYLTAGNPKYAITATDNDTQKHSKFVLFCQNALWEAIKDVDTQYLTDSPKAYFLYKTYKVEVYYDSSVTGEENQKYQFNLLDSTDYTGFVNSIVKDIKEENIKTVTFAIPRRENNSAVSNTFNISVAKEDINVSWEERGTYSYTNKVIVRPIIINYYNDGIKSEVMNKNVSYNSALSGYTATSELFDGLIVIYKVSASPIVAGEYTISASIKDDNNTYNIIGATYNATDICYDVSPTTYRIVASTVSLVVDEDFEPDDLIFDFGEHNYNYYETLIKSCIQVKCGSETYVPTFSSAVPESGAGVNVKITIKKGTSTLTYADICDAGTYTINYKIIPPANANFIGTPSEYTYSIVINQITVLSGWYDIPSTSKIYDGTVPPTTITYALKGTISELNLTQKTALSAIARDYAVAYTNPSKDVGAYSYQVSLTNPNFVFTNLTGTYTITAKDIANVIVGNKVVTKIYTGSSLEVTFADLGLANIYTNNDVTITPPTGGWPAVAGDYSVTISGKNNCSGTKVITLAIANRSLEGIVISKASLNFEYGMFGTTAKVRVPVVKIDGEIINGRWIVAKDSSNLYYVNTDFYTTSDLVIEYNIASISCENIASYGSLTNVSTLNAYDAESVNTFNAIFVPFNTNISQVMISANTMSIAKTEFNGTVFVANNVNNNLSVTLSNGQLKYEQMNVVTKDGVVSGNPSINGNCYFDSSLYFESYDAGERLYTIEYITGNAWSKTLYNNTSHTTINVTVEGSGSNIVFKLDGNVISNNRIDVYNNIYVLFLPNTRQAKVCYELSKGTGDTFSTTVPIARFEPTKNYNVINSIEVTFQFTKPNANTLITTSSEENPILVNIEDRSTFDISTFLTSGYYTYFKGQNELSITCNNNTNIVNSLNNLNSYSVGSHGFNVTINNSYFATDNNSKTVYVQISAGTIATHAEYWTIPDPEEGGETSEPAYTTTENLVVIRPTGSDVTYAPKIVLDNAIASYRVINKYFLYDGTDFGGAVLISSSETERSKLDKNTAVGRYKVEVIFIDDVSNQEVTHLFNFTTFSIEFMIVDESIYTADTVDYNGSYDIAGIIRNENDVSYGVAFPLSLADGESLQMNDEYIMNYKIADDSIVSTSPTVNVPVKLTLGAMTYEYNIPVKVRLKTTLQAESLTATYNGSAQVPTIKVFKLCMKVEDGHTNTYYAEENFLEATLSYSYDNGNTWSSTSPTNVGLYKVKASVARTDNYMGVESIYDFTITPKIGQIVPTVTSKEYNGSSLKLSGTIYFDESDENVTFANNIASSGTLTVKYSDDSGTTWTANPTNAGDYIARITYVSSNGNYAAWLDNIPVKISPQNIVVNFGTTSYTYNGNAQGPDKDTITVNNVADSLLTIQYSSNGSSWSNDKPTNAGEYIVKVTVSSGNYQGEQVEYFSVAKADVTFTWGTTTDFVYNGENKSISVTSNNGNVSVDYSNDNGTNWTATPKDAGTYIARATYGGTTNYNALTEYRSFSVAKADVTFIWTTTVGFVYDGSNKQISASVKATNLNTSAAITYSNDNGGTWNITPSDAGAYIVRAVYNGTNNYKALTEYKTFSIARAAVDISQEVISHTCDGSLATPNIKVQRSGNNIDSSNYTITYEGVLADGTSYSSNTAPSQAGVYDIKVCVTGSNYQRTEKHFTYTIYKATYGTDPFGSLSSVDYSGSDLLTTLNANINTGLESNEYTVAWYKYNATSKTFDLTTTIIGIGEYKAVVVITSNNYRQCTLTKVITVDPIVPTITSNYDETNPFVYTGVNPLVISGLNGIDTSEYTILYSGVSGNTISSGTYSSSTPPTNAGYYTATISFGDNYNNAVYSIDYVITKAPVTIAITSGLEINFGENINIQYTTNDANGISVAGLSVTKQYFDDSVLLAYEPTYTGRYNVKIVASNDNYYGEAYAELVINDVDITALIESKLSITGLEQVYNHGAPTSGITVAWADDGDTIDGVDLSDISIYYEASNGSTAPAWGDGKVYITYSNGNQYFMIRKDYTIGKATIDISLLSIPAFVATAPAVVYNDDYCAEEMNPIITYYRGSIAAGNEVSISDLTNTTNNFAKVVINSAHYTGTADTQIYIMNNNVPDGTSSATISETSDIFFDNGQKIVEGCIIYANPNILTGEGSTVEGKISTEINNAVSIEGYTTSSEVTVVTENQKYSVNITHTPISDPASDGEGEGEGLTLLEEPLQEPIVIQFLLVVYDQVDSTYITYAGKDSSGNWQFIAHTPSYSVAVYSIKADDEVIDTIYPSASDTPITVIYNEGYNKIDIELSMSDVVVKNFSYHAVETQTTERTVPFVIEYSQWIMGNDCEIGIRSLDGKKYIVDNVTLKVEIESVYRAIGSLKFSSYPINWISTLPTSPGSYLIDIDWTTFDAEYFGETNPYAGIDIDEGGLDVFANPVRIEIDEDSLYITYDGEKLPLSFRIYDNNGTEIYDSKKTSNVLSSEDIFVEYYTSNPEDYYGSFGPSVGDEYVTISLSNICPDYFGSITRRVVIAKKTLSGNINQRHYIYGDTVNVSVNFEDSVAGSDYSLVIKNSAGNVVSNNSCLAAGIYTVTATINEGVRNYCGSLSTTIEVARRNTPISFTKTVFEYDGGQKTCTATYSNAAVGDKPNISYTYYYSDTWQTIAPTNAGEYRVKAVIDTANYYGEATTTMKIAKASPTISSINDLIITFGDRITINPSVSNGLESTITYSSDNGNSWNANPSLPGNYLYKVTVGGTDNYNSCESIRSLIIKKIQPTIFFSNLSFTYNGAIQVPTMTVNSAHVTISSSNITTNYYKNNGQEYVAIDSEPVASGLYKMTVSVGKNQIVHAALNECHFVINRATPTVVISDLSYTYDGTNKVCTVSATGVSGESLNANATINYSVDNGATWTATPSDASEYRIRVTVNTDNYFEEKYATMLINRANVNCAITQPTSFVYDDNEKSYSINITGVNSEIISPTIVYKGINGTNYDESQIAPTNVGEYSLKVSYNSNNYNGYNRTILFSIIKADAPSDLLINVPSDMTYSGQQKSCNLSGTSNGYTIRYYKQDSSGTKLFNGKNYKSVARVLEAGNYLVEAYSSNYASVYKEVKVVPNSSSLELLMFNYSSPSMSVTETIEERITLNPGQNLYYESVDYTTYYHDGVFYRKSGYYWQYYVQSTESWINISSSNNFTHNECRFEYNSSTQELNATKTWQEVSSLPYTENGFVYSNEDADYNIVITNGSSGIIVKANGVNGSVVLNNANHYTVTFNNISNAIFSLNYTSTINKSDVSFALVDNGITYSAQLSNGVISWVKVVNDEAVAITDATILARLPKANEVEIGFAYYTMGTDISRLTYNDSINYQGGLVAIKVVINSTNHNWTEYLCTSI